MVRQLGSEQQCPTASLFLVVGNEGNEAGNTLSKSGRDHKWKLMFLKVVCCEIVGYFSVP